MHISWYKYLLWLHNTIWLNFLRFWNIEYLTSSNEYFPNHSDATVSIVIAPEENISWLVLAAIVRESHLIVIIEIL